VVDLAGATGASLERGLGLSAYEAGMLARRGGWRLHGAFDESSAERERERLLGEGLVIETVSEAAARVRPVMAFGGERGETRVWLRTDEGDVTLAGEDLLLVVRGPIAREYQPTDRRRRLGAGSPEGGYRVHLHRRFQPRPVEIDPGNFEFAFTPTGSSRLEIEAWLSALGDDVPQDDTFRQIPPALGVAEPEPRTALSAVGELGKTGPTVHGKSGEMVILDNVAQFRFYSGWRAAIARRRSTAGR